MNYIRVFSKDQKEFYSDKIKVRAVVLVLASHQPVYQNARKVWKQYMNKDSRIKVFFIYGKLNESLPDRDENDLVFDDLVESYPNMIYKRIRGMEHAHSRYEYDYFIHTNISTFWDWTQLHRHLDILPKHSCYSGDGPLPDYNENGYYLSGVDTIVTPEMIVSMLEHKNELNTSLAEDQTLGSYFHGVLKAPFLPTRICMFEDIQSTEDHQVVVERIRKSQAEGKDHYRVKTLKGNRKETDAMIYSHLLEMIYP